MTADRRARGLREPEPGSDRVRRSLPVPDILATCDRLLGEVGRRDHLFAWLRAPGPGEREWLPVDAYYPRARLAVMCRRRTWPHAEHYRELIPAHGLGLLRLDPSALGSDREAVETALAAKLSDLDHAPGVPAQRSENGRTRSENGRTLSENGRARSENGRTRPENGRTRSDIGRTRSEIGRARPENGPSGGSTPVAPHPAAFHAPGSVPAKWTPVRVERTPMATGVEHGLGVVLGLLLAVVLIAEVYLAFTKVAVGGRILMAVAIAIEACSRAVGTVAAERAGERIWAAACAIGGSPVVAWYALLRPGRGDVEPAPLAGRLAVLAGVLALVALLTGN